MKEETTLQNCMYVVEDNVKMGCGERGWDSVHVHHIHVVQDFLKWHVLMYTVTNFSFIKMGHFLTRQATVNF